MKNIWAALPKPFLVQAPMEDVTDTVFRQIIAGAGRPDVFFTEFTNADGIIRGGSHYIEQCLSFNKKIENPIIAQIWGNDPEHYLQSCKILNKLGFSGIDINMGCPVRKVVSKGYCSGLIKNPALAKELYLAAVKGAGGLPVSIKTRIGYSKIQTEEWIGFLLTLNPAAISIHARTAAEMSKVPAHWEEIKKAVDIRNQMKSKTLIIGNGDILSLNQAISYASKYGSDGIMIGRGMLQNPWIFNPQVNIENISVQDRLELLKKHIELFEKTWGKRPARGRASPKKGGKNFEIMKKFYKAYINGFDSAADLRAELMNLHTARETLAKLETTA